MPTPRFDVVKFIFKQACPFPAHLAPVTVIRLLIVIAHSEVKLTKRELFHRISSWVRKQRDLVECYSLQ